MNENKEKKNLFISPQSERESRRILLANSLLTLS